MYSASDISSCGRVISISFPICEYEVIYQKNVSNHFSFDLEIVSNNFSFDCQEWPEEDYPPYANGPGYILSSDIANFIVSKFEKNKLRVLNITLFTSTYAQPTNINT